MCSPLDDVATLAAAFDLLLLANSQQRLWREDDATLAYLSGRCVHGYRRLPTSRTCPFHHPWCPPTCLVPVATVQPCVSSKNHGQASRHASVFSPIAFGAGRDHCRCCEPQKCVQFTLSVNIAQRAPLRTSGSCWPMTSRTCVPVQYSTVQRDWHSQPAPCCCCPCLGLFACMHVLGSAIAHTTVNRSVLFEMIVRATQTRRGLGIKGLACPPITVSIRPPAAIKK